MVLNVSQAAYIRSFRRFIARFSGAIVSHLAKASTQTLDLKYNLKIKIIWTDFLVRPHKWPLLQRGLN